MSLLSRHLAYFSQKPTRKKKTLWTISFLDQDFLRGNNLIFFKRQWGVWLPPPLVPLLKLLLKHRLPWHLAAGPCSVSATAKVLLLMLQQHQGTQKILSSGPANTDPHRLQGCLPISRDHASAPNEDSYYWFCCLGLRRRWDQVQKVPLRSGSWWEACCGPARVVEIYLIVVYVRGGYRIKTERYMEENFTTLLWWSWDRATLHGMSLKFNKYGIYWRFKNSMSTE